MFEKGGIITRNLYNNSRKYESIPTRGKASTISILIMPASHEKGDHLLWKLREFEKEKKKEAALTLYGDAIHSPGDGGFGCAAGQAGQPAALPWS